MNRNVVIIMVGGFTVALLVAMLVQATLSGGKKEVATGPSTQIQIVVAKEDIGAGDSLTNKNLEWQQWPKEASFDGLIIRDGDEALDDAVTGVVRAGITKGQPITANLVVEGDEGGFVAAKLAPGMRAFSINVNPASMVSGFVGPGDYVDIILTYKVDIEIDEKANPNLEEYVRQHVDEFAAETILQNVKVIGVDQKAKRNSDDKAKIARTVTLEVNLREAETLALANEIGDLGLALRRLGDKDIVSNDQPLVTDVRMTGIHKDLQKRLYELSGQGSSQNFNAGQLNEFVRVYSGSGVQTITVTQ